MPNLETVILRSQNPERQRRFYCDMLGMHDLGEGRIGYGQGQAALRFLRAEGPYVPNRSDLYWKIALSVPNIELASSQLIQAGIETSAPHQFRDVGYLAHFNDPDGFAIELIDHWFEGNRPDAPVDTGPLGGGPKLNLITLRASDITATEAQILALGMTPLAIQPVESHGFTLYFYAFTNEQPPAADLRDVANREWLYQRPYTVLEIQHVPSLAQVTRQPRTAAGYEGLMISGRPDDMVAETIGLLPGAG